MLYQQLNSKRKNSKINASAVASIAVTALILFQTITTQAIAAQTMAVSAKSTVPTVTAPTITVPTISQQQAVNSVFNKIKHEDNTIVVNNRSHRAEFNAEGIQFKPQRGPAWRWQLQNPSAKVVHPIISSGAVDYIYKDYTERYLLKANSIEQRFIIEQPYQAKKDLIIEGKISSKGQFETTATGWLWRDKQGVVSLGQVTVFDANGKVLPATMHTEADFSRITVAANVLKTAVYPVTIDPEIGSNDFRLSDMGAVDGDADFDARSPVTAYNSTNNEYLVVWYGDDGGDLAISETEIYGQRVDAITGEEIGEDFRLSDMGLDGDANFDAVGPAVAYNVTNDEYLVVWQGDDVTDGEQEIFGQRIDAATGEEMGTNDFRLSDMGPDGDANFDAVVPAVSYNTTNNEYLVVWQGDDVNGEQEIYGQRIDAATGEEIDANDFRLSDMGPDGDADFDAVVPAVSYNVTNNEYLVVWQGDNNTGLLAEDEQEIYGQRINAATGDEIGVNDFRLSAMGDDGDASLDALRPAVSYNITNNTYFVVWHGDEIVPGLLGNDDFEIFGQRISADASNITDILSKLRLSNMGDNAFPQFDATNSAISYNVNNNEYLVSWHGDNGNSTGQEIYVQRINAATGEEIGDNDVRMSDMGADGDFTSNASNSAISYSPRNNEYLIVWSADDDTSNLSDGEFEIYGQRFAGSATLRFASGASTVDEDAGSIQIEVQRVGDTSNTVTVAFSTADDSATEPSDYTAANGTLTFNPSESSKSFAISINDNTALDGDKTIKLSLSNVTKDAGEVALDSQLAVAVLTITDDDVAASGGGGGAFSLLSLLLLAFFISVTRFVMFTCRPTLHA